MGVRESIYSSRILEGKSFFSNYVQKLGDSCFFFFLRRGFPASSDYHGPNDPKERKDHWSIKLILLQVRGACEPPPGPRWVPKPHGKSEILQNPSIALSQSSFLSLLSSEKKIPIVFFMRCACTHSPTYATERGIDPKKLAEVFSLS